MKKHIGERITTKDGLTAELVKWRNRENVQVEIIETGERIWMPYSDFRKKRFAPNTITHPVSEVTLTQAVTIASVVITIILCAVGGIIFHYAL